MYNRGTAMKTLKIRIVTAEKITTQMKDEFLLGAKTMQIPGILDVEIKFATIKNVLKVIKLESDDDIDQEWLASKVSDGRYHWVHLHVTDREWRKAGLRRSLYGQCELVNRQLITYGRWSVKSVYKFAQNYPAPFNLLPELVLGLWHEGCHGLTKLFALIMGIPYDSVRQKVHHAFYGWNRMYTKQEEEDGLAHRWKVEPTPMQLWLSFPWDLLPDTHQTTLDKLQALIA